MQLAGPQTPQPQQPQQPGQGPQTQPQPSVAPSLPPRATTPTQRQFREPQVTVEWRQVDPSGPIEEVRDPSADPVRWAEQVVRQGNQGARPGQERYSDFILVFRDKNNPDRIVATLPIEHRDQGRQNLGLGTIPAAITGRSNYRVTGISNATFDERTRTFPDARQQTVERWESEGRERNYGTGPEGGSPYVIRLNLDLQARPGFGDGTTRGHAIITFNADGMPSRFLMPNFSGRNPQNPAQVHSDADASNRAVTLMPPVRSRDLPGVSFTPRSWEHTAVVDTANLRTEGTTRIYPTSFAMRNPNTPGVEPTTVTGELRVTRQEGQANPTFEFRGSSQFQRGAAGMVVTFSNTGQPIVQRWRPEIHAPEAHATVQIGATTLTNQRVYPVVVTDQSGRGQRGAYLHFDAENRMQVLPQTSVSLLRPSLSVGAQVPGQANQYSGTLTQRTANDQGQIVETQFEVVIAVNGQQVSATAKNQAQAAQVTQAMRQLRGSVAEGGSPSFAPVLPLTGDRGSAADVEVVRQVVAPFQVRPLQSDPNRLEVQTPLDLSEPQLMIGAGTNQEVAINLRDYLPSGVTITNPRLAEQSTLLNGVRVIPFTFTSPRLEGLQTGYLRLVESGLSLRREGKGTAVRMRTDLRIDGIRIFPENQATAHTSDGFIPLRPAR